MLSRGTLAQGLSAPPTVNLDPPPPSIPEDVTYLPAFLAVPFYASCSLYSSTAFDDPPDTPLLRATYICTKLERASL